MARTLDSYSTASQAPMLQRVWQSMRIMRQFSRSDLVATAEAGVTGVERYVRALLGAGYVRLVQARVSGRPGSRDRFALVRDSGPLAPIARRDGSGVFDPNTQQAWSPSGRPLAEQALKAGMSLAQREALRLALQNDGAVKASFEALAGLSRMGLVHLRVELTELGRNVATSLPEPHSQRAPHGEAHA